MIAVAFRDVLPEDTAAEFDQLVQGITAFAYREHDQDGHHTNITADSLTMNPPSLTNGVLGTIIFQDEHGNKTVFSRTDTDGTVITLRNGQALLIQSTDPAGAVSKLIRLGTISSGAVSGPGWSIQPKLTNSPTIYHEWAFVGAEAPTGNAAQLSIVDKTLGVSPLALRYRGAATAWEWMKTAGGIGPSTEKVTLGSRFDSSLAGFFDEADIKELWLRTVANGSARLGLFTDVSYNAGNFSWSVTAPEQTTFGYELDGPTMTVYFDLSGTSVVGTPSTLDITIPLGFTCQRAITTMVYGVDNGTEVFAKARIASGDTLVKIEKVPSAAWSTSTNLTTVRGQIRFPVEV